MVLCVTQGTPVLRKGGSVVLYANLLSVVLVPPDRHQMIVAGLWNNVILLISNNIWKKKKKVVLHCITVLLIMCYILELFNPNH